MSDTDNVSVKLIDPWYADIQLGDSAATADLISVNRIYMAWGPSPERKVWNHDKRLRAHPDILPSASFGRPRLRYVWPKDSK